jgi:PAS domain S-box-containing protein
VTNQGLNMLAMGLCPGDLEALEVVLGELDSALVRARSPAEVSQRLAEPSLAAVVLDAREADLLPLAQLVRQRSVPLLLWTEPGPPSASVLEVCRLGEVDLLVRPMPPEVLRCRLSRLLSPRGQGREVEYRTLFELSAVGVAQLDLDTGRFVRVNQRLCEILGYPEAELLARRSSELTHPEDLDRDLAAVLPVLCGEADRWDIEKRHVRADGGVSWVAVTGRLVRDPSGRPHQTVVTVTDITRMRASAERLGLAQLYGAVGVWSWDLATGEVAFEPEFERLYGLAPGSLLTYERWASYVDPDDLRRLEPRREAALAAGEPFAFEFRIRRADGEDRWLLSKGRGEYDSAGRLLSVLGVNIDITERKRAEEAVQRSEAALRSLLDNTPSMTGVVELLPDDSDVLHVLDNAYAERFFGVGRGQTSGRWARRDLGLPPETVARWARAYREAQARGRPVRFADGTPGRLWLDVSVSSLGPGPEGRDRFCYVALDDTERQRAEARFQTLVDGAPVAIGMARDGRNLYANPAWRRLFGWGERDEIAGTSILAVAVPEEHERIRQNIRRRYSGGPAPPSYEFMAQRRDGSRFLAQVEVGQIELPDGAATLAFFTDVTERRRSEQRTRSLLRLDDEIRALTDPQQIIESSAQLLGELLQVSRCAYAEVEADEQTFRLLGGSGALGADPFAALDPAALPELRADRPHVADSQAVVCVPLRKGGRLVGAMAVQRGEPRAWQPDEIELLRAVASRSWESIERARALRALQEADRRKDQFLATLAHELRNPLAPLSNALAVWALAGKAPARAAELRALMDRQVRQLTRLIDDLLDISRISRGKIELRRQPLDLGTVVDGALEALRPFVDARGHALSVERPTEPVVLHGDPGRLVQVVSNLVHNAAKYTGRSGHIRVLARREGPEAVIRVRDDGPGIPAEMLPHIFDMFTQVDQTLTRSHGGLGIGLTLVKSLVEMHGGRVEAHSAGPGQGSEFAVRLPLAAGAGARAGARAEGASPPEGAALPPRSRVLVVDDVRASADTLVLMLGALGQDALAAYDGLSALAAAQQFRPDVVFSDIAMPGMDGYELARHVRGLGRRVTLVALTGYGQEEDRLRAAEAGFDHHLVKPATVEALQQVLMSV